jgi:hypothetical protein
MRQALISFAHGELFDKMASITFPRMYKYAQYHGIYFTDTTDNHDTTWDYSRPWSWNKVPLILEYLREDYEVLWVDADVYIRDYRFNIFEELDPYAFHGMVLHNVPNSYVPNCGVWVLRPSMIPYLEEMWGMTQYINHCNWEQAAFIKLIGGNPDKIDKFPMPHWKVEHHLEFHTTWLDYKWNQHPMDVRRFNCSGLFWHCTQFTDRLKTLESWDGKSNG